LIVKCLFTSIVLLIPVAGSLAQTSQLPDLAALEQSVAGQFNELRVKSALKPLKIRRDIRQRMVACAVQNNGTDPTAVELYRRWWYLTDVPSKPNDELARLATTNNSLTKFNDHIAVGVWYARTPAYPSGMYWVSLYLERSAANEAFWGHFPLTDSAENRRFGKEWKRGIPQQCRTIK
jgi:hypothetical protein